MTKHNEFSFLSTSMCLLLLDLSISHTHTCIEHTTWCFGFFIQWVQINAKVIVEHRSTRNNLCCEKVLLSTIFGMVRSVINYHTIHIDVYATCISLFFDRNVVSRVIQSGISMARKQIQMYGEFLQSHQKFKTQFYTSFCRTSRALYHHFFLHANKFILMASVSVFLLAKSAWKLDIVWQFSLLKLPKLKVLPTVKKWHRHFSHPVTLTNDDENKSFPLLFNFLQLWNESFFPFFFYLLCEVIISTLRGIFHK